MSAKAYRYYQDNMGLDLESPYWEPVGEMYEARYLHSCGVVRRVGGRREIVVVGGVNKTGNLSSVEIFSVHDCSWRTGDY